MENDNSDRGTLEHLNDTCGFCWRSFAVAWGYFFIDIFGILSLDMEMEAGFLIKFKYFS